MKSAPTVAGPAGYLVLGQLVRDARHALGRPAHVLLGGWMVSLVAESRASGCLFDELCWTLYAYVHPLVRATDEADDRNLLTELHQTVYEESGGPGVSPVEPVRLDGDMRRWAWTTGSTEP